MRIIFEQDEIGGLPADARKMLGDDLEIEIEHFSELSETFENVKGLKSALKKERIGHTQEKAAHQAAVEKLKLASNDTEALAEKDAEIGTLTQTITDKDSEITKLNGDIKTRDQDGKITDAVTKFKGNLDLLRPHVRAALDENPDADLDETMTMLRDTYPGAFKAAEQSGSGMTPGHTGDGPSGLQRNGGSKLPMRRGEFSDVQKVEYIKQHGVDGFMSLPD